MMTGPTIRESLTWESDSWLVRLRRMMAFDVDAPEE
jgi:hypothetical protein